MKSLRISVERDGRPLTEVRVEPPTLVTLGSEASCTIVTPGLPELVLFDHFGAQYRLLVVPGMTGSLSFSGYRGPFEALTTWRAGGHGSVPIGLKNRACGDVHLGGWCFRFVHAPLAADIEPSGPPPVRSVLEVAEGVWICRRCHERNLRSTMFCMGCGQDVAIAAVDRPEVRHGARVMFRSHRSETWGRIVAGPNGAHRVYEVESPDGARYSVPEVLLEMKPS